MNEQEFNVVHNIDSAAMLYEYFGQPRPLEDIHLSYNLNMPEIVLVVEIEEIRAKPRKFMELVEPVNWSRDGF